MSADHFPANKYPSKQIFFHQEEIQFSHPEQETIKRWITESIINEGFDFEMVNIIFCSDSYLHNLNTTYLNHDTYTDIITFQYSDSPIEGDLFISIDRVKENAKNLEIDELKELNRVIIHGILHLIGFDDKSPEEKSLMTIKENEYLEYLRGLKK